MIVLQTWQLIAVLVITFLFGWRIGWINGEGHAWQKMDDEERKADT